MGAYSEAYLEEVVENQGRLFGYVAEKFPDKDTEDFIHAYMVSRTRKYIDESQAYVNTMDARELWKYFMDNDNYHMKPGKVMTGFMPDWIGEFYVYYQWYYDLPSAEVIEKIPVDFLQKAYAGFHDLELELAVQKVGAIPDNSAFL